MTEIALTILSANESQLRARAELLRESVTGVPVVACWLGGPGGGKTTLSIEWACQLLADHENIAIGMFRETHSSFDLTTRHDFLNAIPREVYTPESEGDIWQFKGDRMGRLLWCGLENYRERRGLVIGAAIIDQAETISEDQFDYVIERTRQEEMPLSVLVLANVPDKKAHWLYDRFNGSHPDFRMVTGGLEQNRENIPDAYYKAMTQGRSQEYLERYVHGKWIPPQNQPAVYPGYRVEMRTPDNIEAVQGTVWEGFDGGPTDNYLAYVPFQRQGGRIVVLGELLGDHGTGIRQFAEEVCAMRGDLLPSDCRYQSYADQPMFTRAKTDGASPADVLREYGIIVRPGETSMQLRHSAVTDLLSRVTASGESVLSVNPRSVIFHEGMSGGYHMIIGIDGKYSQRLKNAPSHIIEAFETCYARMLRDNKGRHAYDDALRKLRMTRMKPRVLWGAMR